MYSKIGIIMQSFGFMKRFCFWLQK